MSVCLCLCLSLCLCICVSVSVCLIVPVCKCGCWGQRARSLRRRCLLWLLLCSDTAEYVEVLQGLLPTVVSVAADPLHPDSVFIEDAAVVIGDTAFITTPG